jgi:excisionase family DNA binding protein
MRHIMGQMFAIFDTPALYMQAQANASTESSDVRLLTREQTWKRINCSQRHLHNLVISGDLPYVKIGKLIRFIPADVDAYVESHRVGGADNAGTG